ncbi:MULTISPECIES: transporter [Haloferax]|uniref:Transporter n=1 Tax=Haloferax marinum TaxID=2666143 RepID=A0A6A8G5G3_9EURY|nr:MULTISPECIES: transporter [Haloferax]KAB1196827.1 transporter [Haloferax sp. CBA1150]MRW95838.1 transporter [Haloferax marinum]
MALIDTVMATVHLLVGGLWTGSVLFFALAVLPTARSGEIRAGAFESIISRLTMGSRVAALLMFVTGGHLAGTRYTVGSLFGSGRGHLVLTMLVLWLGLTALVEVGQSRAKDGLAQKKVRTPAENAAPFYLGAALVAVLLLLDAGLLLN